MKTVLACQVIFGTPLELIFPELYERIEEQTMQQIEALHRELMHLTTPAGLRKCALLREALGRTSAPAENVKQP